MLQNTPVRWLEGGKTTTWLPNDRLVTRHDTRENRTRYKLEVAGSISFGVMKFFIDIILPAALWTGVDSESNRNEYQGYFLWGGG